MSDWIEECKNTGELVVPENVSIVGEFVIPNYIKKIGD